MIPGINVLAKAQSLLGTKEVTLIPFESRTKNQLGQWISKYGDPVTLRASWQPISRAKYTHLGLDMTKIYFNLYVCYNVRGIDTQTTPDRVAVDSRLYDIISVRPWANQDGWNACIAVEIGEYDE